MDIEFQNLKKEIIEMDTLFLPDNEKSFVLRTDASNIGLGAVLYQVGENGEHQPIHWASRNLVALKRDMGYKKKKY